MRDVDGDGNVDIFIPEANYIHVLTFKGIPNPTPNPVSLEAMIIELLFHKQLAHDHLMSIIKYVHT